MIVVLAPQLELVDTKNETTHLYEIICLSDFAAADCRFGASAQTGCVRSTVTLRKSKTSSSFRDGGCDGGGRTSRGTDVNDGTYSPPSALTDFRNDGIITLFLPLAAGGGDDVPPPGEDADVDLSPLMATTGTAAAAVAGTGDAISSVVAAVFFVVAH